MKQKYEKDMLSKAFVVHLLWAENISFHNYFINIGFRTINICVSVFIFDTEYTLFKGTIIKELIN